MKGTFYAPKSLYQLEETLKSHSPYAMLVVSTTGLDNKKFDGHMPTKVTLKKYSYNDELKKYEQEITFDKLVACGEKALNEAIKNIDSYDVFKNGGIDLDDYKAGKGVLSQEDFKKEFDFLMQGLRQDNATVILNGGMQHCETFLDKIGCADELRKINEGGKVLDQTSLTQEYMQKHDLKGKATLESLRNIMAAPLYRSFANDEEKMVDFKKLSKEDFLESYSYLTEKEYDTTAKDVARREEKIIGGFDRINVMNSFVSRYGREENILENEWDSFQREAAASYTKQLSESGKEKYKSESLNEKLNILIAKKSIIPEKIAQGDSEYHKLIAAMQDSGKKGIVIMHTATTGFERTKAPQNTGFPIQFCAIAYPVNNGIIDINAKNNAVSFNIKAPQKSVLKAEENLKHGGFDAFKDADIDLVEYKEGKNVITPEKAAQKISEYFEMFPLEDYTLVTLGGDFAQTSLLNIGNLPVCKAERIDFSQAVKDYAFLEATDASYPANVLFDTDSINGKTFGIKDMAEANGVNDISGTVRKCMIASRFINRLENQYMELFKPEEMEKDEPVLDDNAEESFIELDGYARVEKSIETDEEKRVISDAFADTIADTLKQGESIRMMPSDIDREVPARREHGNIYSDMENDTADVVMADRIQKVGEVDIPHVSESRPIRERRDRMPRPEPRREAEGFARREESPRREDNMDSASLLRIIEMQNRAISRQSEIINGYNEQLFSLLKEQNDIMKEIISDKNLENGLSNNTIERVEAIKEQIDSLKDECSEKAGRHLMDANKSLSESQRAIEQAGLKNEKNHG